MRQPRLRAPEGMDGLYHVVSRVVEKRLIFRDKEKRKFRELMLAYADFSGLEIAAWCLMGNHFHLLLHVPDKASNDPFKLPEKEILRRISKIYDLGELDRIHRILEQLPDAAARMEWLQRYTCRMGDLSIYMKALKQCFTQWYNRVHQRDGTLWESRFKSLVVEIQEDASLGHIAKVVSAYIDLNPVRAGLVKDPAEYEWSGYGLAARREKSSERGILLIMGRELGTKSAMAQYRKFLFSEGSAARQEHKDKVRDKKTGELKTRIGIDEERVASVLASGGEIPAELLAGIRFRSFIDAGAMGCDEFLQKLSPERPRKARSYHGFAGTQVLRKPRQR